jgi:integral membrane protein (TIGR01906 family)
MQSTEGTTAEGFTLPGWLVTVFRVTIIAALPLALALLNARLLMSTPFLRWEYSRLPPDPFGFSTEDRLTYAPLALDYLFNDTDIDFLGDQTFADGLPLYNERELRHMHDVKVVTGKLVTVGVGVVVLLALSIAALAWRSPTHPQLQGGLFQGSVLTVGLLVALIVSVAISFNTFFVQFHALFFEGDSWIFLYSDTLIRLFPEQFWTDAFVLLFGGAIVEALVIGGAAWWWGRRLPS